jgi:uncharacterized membrane protein YeaQ/YmgE (transglycosylase-associated protein family)
MPFLYFLLVGLIAGWLAGQIMKGSGYGVIGDIVIGIIGAFIGGWLFGVLGLTVGGSLIGSICMALVGAIVLIFIVRLFKRA